MTILHDVVNASLGGGIALAILVAGYYKSIVNAAQEEARQALALAEDAVKAKNQTFETFEKIKAVYESQKNNPPIIVLTEEQVKLVGKTVAVEIMPLLATDVRGMVQ